MKLSDNIKATRLHRLYTVIFWLLITVPIVLVALTTWVQPRLVSAQIAVSEYARTHNIPPEIAMQQWTESQDRINTWTTVALVSCAGFVLALLLPLLYRVFLYILHGKTAFKPQP